MFDECDEGTAIFKIAATASQVPPPQGTPPCVAFVTADEDGLAIPSDWYLQLVGSVSQLFRDSERLPDAKITRAGGILPVDCSPALQEALLCRQAEIQGASEHAARAVRQVGRWRGGL